MRQAKIGETREISDAGLIKLCKAERAVSIGLKAIVEYWEKQEENKQLYEPTRGNELQPPEAVFLAEYRAKLDAKLKRWNKMYKEALQKAKGLGSDKCVKIKAEFDKMCNLEVAQFQEHYRQYDIEIEDFTLIVTDDAIEIEEIAT